MSQILLVDDDVFLLDTLNRLLTRAGYTCKTATNAQDGLRAVTERAPDLAVLDLALPDEDGFSLCRKLRHKWMFPILMLTSSNDVLDKVVGLEVGADDYLSKPFESRELIARIRALIRRSTEYTGPDSQEEEITTGPLMIKHASRTVTVNSCPVELTEHEFKLLNYLVRNTGRALSREQLFESVWGYDVSFNSSSLEVFVYRLRKKLGQHSNCPLIHTVRGYGYRFEIGADTKADDPD